MADVPVIAEAACVLASEESGRAHVAVGRCQ